MDKPVVGTHIRYRPATSPVGHALDQTGRVKVAGGKYVTITNDITQKTSKDDYSYYGEFEVIGSSSSPISSDEVSTQQPQSKLDLLQAQRAEVSLFSFLKPGSAVQFQYVPKEGLHFGFFSKYEKHFHRVFVKTIPAFGRESQEIVLHQELVTPYKMTSICLGRCWGMTIANQDHCVKCGSRAVTLGETADAQLAANPRLILDLRKQYSVVDEGRTVISPVMPLEEAF